MATFSHVSFLPWIGKYYHSAPWGGRLLILGESHYGADPGEADENFTIKVVSDYVNGFRHRYWTVIANTFLQGPFKDIIQDNFWHYVAFYNYVQEFAGQTSRIAPTEEAFSQSKNAFHEVLDTLAPDFILVTGKRLWEHLPACATSGPPIELAEYKLQHETRIYTRLDGHHSFATMTYHPSWPGYQYKRWSPVATGLLNLRKKI